MNDDQTEALISNFVEITLEKPDNFLKVKETLTRMGIPSFKEKKLYQSCHILHKRGKYYIVHFKELFALDGKQSSLSEEDIERRNTIANLLEDWSLIKINKPEKTKKEAALTSIKIVPYREKHVWSLESKYTIGNK